MTKPTQRSLNLPNVRKDARDKRRRQNYRIEKTWWYVISKHLSSSDQSRSQHRCNVCDEVFASRTKLFDHITEEGHALATSEQEAKPHKGKQKKR